MAYRLISILRPDVINLICIWQSQIRVSVSLAILHTVYPKKYAHGFCFAVLCCGYTLTDLPISIRLTSLALWQSDDCPSASKATLMNMDKYFIWIHYEGLHYHNKAKHNKTVSIFLGIYCKCLHSFPKPYINSWLCQIKPISPGMLSFISFIWQRDIHYRLIMTVYSIRRDITGHYENASI